MSKVVIDMSMSLDGFVAGPDDDVTHVFEWYTSGQEEVRDPIFRPEPGANRDEVERMFAESGAYIFGRRTYEITDGWGGRHPVNGVPTFVLTHTPPANYPRGPSNLTFVTDGIERAVRRAQAVAGDNDVLVMGGPTIAQQAVRAGLVDEISIHVVPVLLGAGSRPFEHLGPEAIELERIELIASPQATHLRFRVVKSEEHLKGGGR